MVIESLQQLFINETIECIGLDIIPDIVNNKYVRINLDNEINTFVVVLDCKEYKTFDFDYCYTCKVKNKISLNKLSSITKNGYIAKITNLEKNRFDLLIVNYGELSILEHINIGICDKALKVSKLTIDKFKQDIIDNFYININGADYVVIANNIYDNSKQFTILNEKDCINIKFIKKGEIPEAKDIFQKDDLDDDIFVIDTVKHRYDKNNYKLKLAKVDFDFVDITRDTMAKRSALLFIQSNLEKYITDWEQYINIDYEYYLSIVKKASVLHFKNAIIKGEEIELEIGNKQEIPNFCSNLFKISNSKSTSPDLVLNFDNDKKVYVKYKSHYEGILTCIQTQENLLNIQNKGFVSINSTGYEVQYERRQKAIKRILEGESGIPNLAKILAGESVKKRRNLINIPNAEIKKVFGNNKPTDNQLKAISIALNTPDIAIIQGPPGTGKTKTIRAIQNCISVSSKDDTLVYAKNLLTAYQNEATKKLIKKQTIYGLPTNQVVSDGNSLSDLGYEFNNWIKRVISEFNVKNPGIETLVDNNKNEDNIHSILSRYMENVDTYSIENNLVELNSLLELEEDDILSKYILDINLLLNEAKRIKNSSIPCINNLDFINKIPEDNIVYSDNGEQVAAYNIFALEMQYENNKEAIEIIKQIEDCFKDEQIDFNKVKILKNELYYLVYPQDKLIINQNFNNKVITILNKIENEYLAIKYTNRETILKDYLYAFKYDKYQIKSAIDKLVETIAATHQMSADESIALKKNLDSDQYNDYYNNYDELSNTEIDVIEEKSANLFYENVIIDEAARSCPPDMLIPMSSAKERIILVGDHKQLPQFINDEVYKMVKEKKTIHDISLLKKPMFERLKEKVADLYKIDGIERFITLDTQFRMKKSLADFVSRNFYEKSINGEQPIQLKSVIPDKEFEHNLPSISNKEINNKAMVWVNLKDSEEHFENPGYTNEIEADFIAQYLSEILSDPNCNNLTIGVMSFYRAQINLIKEKLLNYSIDGINICVKENDGNIYVNKELRPAIDEEDEEEEKLLIDTVDAFQGLEFDIVLLSITRARNNYSKKGSFGHLSSPNRLCVALSRQKRCLILVGNEKIVVKENSEKEIPSLCDFYRRCKREAPDAIFI